MYRQRQDRKKSLRSSQWLIGMLLAVSLSGLFLSISAVQLTSPGNGQGILKQGIVLVTDIDNAIPGINESLKEEAALSESEMTQIPIFPIPLQMPKTQAAVISDEDLREYITEKSALMAYEQGIGIFDQDGQQDIGLLSSTGAIDRGLSIITSDNHERIRITSAVLIVISLILGILLILSTRSYTRLIAVGTAIVAATIPPLAGLVALRFIFRGAQDSNDPFVNNLLGLGIDAIWIPLRNEIAFAALGAALIGTGIVFSLLASRWPDHSSNLNDRQY